MQTKGKTALSRRAALKAVRRRHLYRGAEVNCEKYPFRVLWGGTTVL